MQFPLQIVFKLLAFAPQMYVSDETGSEIGYVRQKLLAFKERVTVFSDESQATPIYTISADRVIDFTANYHFAEADGRPIGYVRREGVRSLWRSHYIVYVGAQPVFEINEQSAWVRFADNLVGEIPFVGAFTGYFLNPTYIVSRLGGHCDVLRMVKQPTLLETHFTIAQTGDIGPEEQVALLLSLMMIILLERSRG